MTMLARGLLKRCPRCGRPKIFKSFFELPPNCPHCGYQFEREEGYWTGAMIVNIGACMAWFAVLFVGTIIVTLPDVEWVPLLGVALFTMGILPIVFYPHSKTIWMAFDLYWHPLRDQ
ncbi:MAG: hypothetical protein QOH26_825 [Actinomycetota bacterium]|jgi:uncharacterized protein (DUF983 family)|nr:hypothetical protein [Actinomycetota bacterium]